ncbi:helix-turn-helix transcriptional regulator [Luteimicrobium subarcticum]|uniref:Putative DNA-binding transcriptional regulator YafY n=1 Tax=Luteimicrobium subarcticum TaxID=620910 RepID=A0A2M8WW79_9MICO|nr:WYL domain-containing protein [Luteimicrobium subarcticum]PJI95173.1 putative DNA-binding transcriptional regulator YafY [Luteimicrobium subarcticum]
MLRTSSRLLSLLALLQSRPVWPGAALAERLDVTTRTVRLDVDRLRELGYPIDSTPGRGGGYRLGPGGRMPPLLLDDAEAVAVALGLRAVRGVAGVEDAAASARTKLAQVLPHPLQRRVDALTRTTESGPQNTDSNVADPVVDHTVLTRIADAVRDHERLRARVARPCADGSAVPDASDDVVRRADLEPYRLVAWQRRWYLVAREVPSGAWRALRVDWLDLSAMPQPRFTPRPMTDDEYTRFVVHEVASAGWAVHARVTVLASADEVRSRINDAVGVVEPVDEMTSVLVTGSDSVEVLAVYLGMLGLDFRVDSPPALVEHVRVLARRYGAAAR